MYIFKEDFSIVNDCKMPYTVTEEITHAYKNTSCKAENGRLYFAREGVRLIFKTPVLSEFDFSCKLGYIPPIAVEAFGEHLSWAFFFGYDPETRTGKKLALRYFCKTNIFNISLFDVCGKNKTLICEKNTENVTLDENRMLDFNYSVKDGKCKGSFEGIDFCFDCVGNTAGKIAFCNNVPFQEVIFADMRIESNDVDYTTVLDRNYIIPHYDGGSEDYCMHIEVKKYDGGSYELCYELTGGAYSRNTPDYLMSAWTVQYDIFTNPYIRFYGKRGTEKLYLKNGELCFVEQNEKITYTEMIMHGEKMPYRGSFYFEEFDENSDFAFGYDLFRRLGNEMQEGTREFVYNKDELVYSGTPLSEDCIITVKSPENKKMANSLPKDIDRYEKALFHAQNNHYFFYDEDVRFAVTAGVKKNAEFASVKIILLDAFFNEIKEIEAQGNPCEKFTHYGFETTEYNVNLGKMAQGVYHIKVQIFLGNEVFEEHKSAFEVFDESDISPRASSGIPFMYSGEAAPPNIEYNCPDPWMIKPDHNEVHYFDCMLAVPEVVENRNGWEILKMYKREMFLWANWRTVPKGKTYYDYPKSLSVTDYLSTTDKRAPILFYNATRDTFKDEAVIKIYNAFKEEHKDYDLFDMPQDGVVSRDVYVEFFKKYGTEWIQYLSENNTLNILKYHDEIKEKYPHIKFSNYGPYNYYSARYFGIRRSNFAPGPKKYAHTLMDGFWILEDYPFITGQNTHGTGWNAMQLMLNMPKANVLLEIFGSFDPVCPDNFVFHAFPPMGYVFVESYRAVTQVYEYVYAPIFKDGAFRYKNNPSFQFLQSYNTQAGQRFEEFLKAWGVYLKNKPVSPLKSPVFVIEYPDEDDRFDFDNSERDANNVSQAGQGYLYEIMSEAGLPKGFSTDFESLCDIDENMTDVCVLPSLKNVSDDVKKKIRSLSSKGVALVAVSDIGDLTDLFGVKELEQSAKIASVETATEREVVARRNAEFLYSENGAQTLLYAVGEDGKKYPFVLKYGKNILINSYICRIGSADTENDFFGIANISKLLRQTLTKCINEVSTPVATASGCCGISLFKTQNGKTGLVLTDYTICTVKESKTVTVKLNIDAQDVECVCHKDMQVVPNLIKKDGKVCAFIVTLRPGESAMFEIK